MKLLDFWRRKRAGLKWLWSLDDSSLRNILWQYRTVSETMGVKMNEEMTTQEVQVKRLVFIWLSIILVVVGMGNAVKNSSGHRRFDIECIFSALSTSLFKIIWFLRNRHAIMDLLYMALKHNASLTSNEQAALGEEMKAVKWKYRTFCVTQIVTIVAYYYSPVIDGTSSTPNYPLLFPGFEDETTYLNIMFYHLLRPFLGFMMWLLTLSFWILFVAVVGHACAHAKAIEAEVSSLNSTDENITSRIRYVAKRHQQLKTFIAEINKLTSMPIGTELALVVGCVCFSYQEPCEITVLSIGYIMAFSLLYCYFGQYAITAGEGIEVALYNTDWHTMTTRDARMVLLMLMNSQNPSKLAAYKAFKLTHVNFVAFVRILYSSFSFFLSTRK